VAGLRLVLHGSVRFQRRATYLMLACLPASPSLGYNFLDTPMARRPLRLDPFPPLLLRRIVFLELDEHGHQYNSTASELQKVKGQAAAVRALMALRLPRAVPRPRVFMLRLNPDAFDGGGRGVSLDVRVGAVVAKVKELLDMPTEQLVGQYSDGKAAFLLYYYYHTAAEHHIDAAEADAELTVVLGRAMRGGAERCGSAAAPL
jgi:hypothetical protein